MSTRNQVAKPEWDTLYLTMMGIRAEFPAEMSDEVKSLITQCWDDDPDPRPSFSDIRRDLERIEFKIFADVNSPAVKQMVNDIVAGNIGSEVK
jgi:hypothetical protein